MKHKCKRSTTTWKISTSVRRHERVVSAGQECHEMRGMRQRGGGKDNADSRPAASNGKERRRESERTKTKKKEGNTLMFDTRCSPRLGGRL
jgi:hypothetical protein